MSKNKVFNLRTSFLNRFAGTITSFLENPAFDSPCQVGLEYARTAGF